MDKRPAYFDQLEKEWERNKSAAKCKKEADRRTDHLIERMYNPKVSFDEIYDALIALLRRTNDKRFIGALEGLQHHRSELIDHKGGWLNGITEVRPLIRDSDIRCRVKEKKDEGNSEKKACAIVAAEVGFPALSFDSAVQRVRKLYRAPAWELPTIAIYEAAESWENNVAWHARDEEIPLELKRHPLIRGS